MTGDFEPLGYHGGVRDSWGFRTSGLSWWGEGGLGFRTPGLSWWGEGYW